MIFAIELGILMFLDQRGSLQLPSVLCRVAPTGSSSAVVVGFSQLTIDVEGCRSQRGAGVNDHSQNFTDKLILSQPGGQIMLTISLLVPPGFSDLPTAPDVTTKLEESHNATCIPRDPTNAKAIYHCSNTINFKPQNEMWESDLFLFYLPTVVFIDSIALLYRACMYVF